MDKLKEKWGACVFFILVSIFLNHIHFNSINAAVESGCHLDRRIVQQKKEEWGEIR